MRTVTLALLLTAAACKTDSATIPDATAETSGDVVTDTAGDTAEDTTADTTPPPDVPDTGDTSDTNDVGDTSDTGDTGTADGSDADADTVSFACTGDDCVRCIWQDAPKTVADCTCPFCPAYATSAAECQARQAAWDAVCGGDNWFNSVNCPVASCLPLPPLTCDAGECVEACDTSLCAPLECPEGERVTPPGECCARCEGRDSCDDAAECANCVYGAPVTRVEDCYCPVCPTYPMSAAQCADNRTGWEQHCTEWAANNPCPVPRCIPLAAPVCDDGGQCQANPDGCFDSSECGSCRFSEPPRGPSECACPGCPVPTSITHCEAIEQAVTEHCADFDFEACPLPSCARPPAIGCTTDRVCGYGDLLPE